MSLNEPSAITAVALKSGAFFWTRDMGISWLLVIGEKDLDHLLGGWESRPVGSDFTLGERLLLGDAASGRIPQQRASVPLREGFARAAPLAERGWVGKANLS